MVFCAQLRSWSSSSIFLRKWVTGTPPVTHTYIQAIKQPTLHYLTRSVRRQAATSKRRNRRSGFRRKEFTGFRASERRRFGLCQRTPSGTESRGVAMAKLSQPVQVIPLSPCFGNASFFYAIDRKGGRREYFAGRWIRAQIPRLRADKVRTHCHLFALRDKV